MERMGATASREAMMMPISQMLAVSRRAHVGSPLALPCPNTCSNMEGLSELTFYSTFLARIQIKWCDNHVWFCSLRHKIHMLSQRFWSCWYVLSLFLFICILVLQCLLTLKNGMMPSREMACRRRGAPVRLWRPAPHVEKKEPNTMTHGEGHARVPITRLPLTPSPNLPWELKTKHFKAEQTPTDLFTHLSIR